MRSDGLIGKLQSVFLLTLSCGYVWTNGFQTAAYGAPTNSGELLREGALLIHTARAAEAQPAETQPKGSGPVSFRTHLINADSRFEAAGICDVNRDGRLDIFCGGYWYEAPNWKQHFVRQIPEQSEYHHDFANLPYDVDGDGWTDIVNATWHSRSLFWVRNPGSSGGGFTVVEIDRPGNMETALLSDINGDGHLDILPAINQVPAWFEARVHSRETRWIKHELPPEAKGHGIGAGDVDGDGNCDVVSPKGWLRQKPGLQWEWHPDFELGSASIPVLVHDVDGDDDADVIWGMAHDYGLYWLEQSVVGKSKRSWKRHLIDESWSQVHFLVLADLDGDGREDLITGKRYRAHNGKDPGSEDPLCVYWYRFEPNERIWVRHPVEEGNSVGFGISTSAADIDADGDVDIVAPGKSGLYLLENLLN
jgi:hypothetical protein